MSPARRLPGPVGPLAATVRVPTSKSLTNRALVMAAVAGGGTIETPLDCDDTRALAGALAAAGWQVDWGESLAVGGRRPAREAVAVDLRDSGTGARFALALLAAVPGRWRVDGSARLRQRPMAPLVEALRQLGADIEARDGCLPADVVGRTLPGGGVTIRPQMSSQFVSALLLAAPLMARPLEAEVLGEAPSMPYLDLTAAVLEAFGAEVERSPDRRRWRVEKGALRPGHYAVEGDWSAAAFFAAAAAVVGGEVRIGPLDGASRQGDRVLCEVLERAGVELRFDGRELVVRGPALGPVEAHLGDAPDLFPALAAVAAVAGPGSVLRGLEHLRHKESDRLAAMVDNLRRLGARVAADGSSLRVLERAAPAVGDEVRVHAAGDHRIAMATAVACLALGPASLDEDSVVAKSFPAFWHEWASLVAGAGRRGHGASAPRCGRPAAG